MGKKKAQGVWAKVGALGAVVVVFALVGGVLGYMTMVGVWDYILAGTTGMSVGGPDDLGYGRAGRPVSRPEHKRRTAAGFLIGCVVGAAAGAAVFYKLSKG